MYKQSRNNLNPFSTIKELNKLNKKIMEQKQTNKRIVNMTSFNQANSNKHKAIQKKSQEKDLITKINDFIQLEIHKLKNFKIRTIPYILVRIEYKSDNGAVFSFFNFDFDPIDSIVIKDISTNKYSTIHKREVYSYYTEDKFLYLRLKNNTKLKIRCLN